MFRKSINGLHGRERGTVVTLPLRAWWGQVSAGLKNNIMKTANIPSSVVNQLKSVLCRHDSYSNDNNDTV